MPIPTLPAGPQPTDDVATFNTKSFAFVAAMDPWGVAVQAVGDAAEADATSAAASAALAGVYSASANTKATEAAISAAQAAASAASNAVLWVSGVTYTGGTLQYDPVNFAAYRRKTTGSGTVAPRLSPDYAPAVASNGLAIQYYYTAVSGTTIPDGSPGVRFTSSGLTQNGSITLPSPSAYPSGSTISISREDGSGIYNGQRVLSAGTMIGVAGNVAGNYFVAYQTDTVSWTPVAGTPYRTAFANVTVSTAAANLYYQRVATWKNKFIHIATDSSTDTDITLSTITSALTATTGGVFGGSLPQSFSSNGATPAFMSDSLVCFLGCSGSATNYPIYYTYTYSGNTLTYAGQNSWDTGGGTQGYPYGHARISDTSALVAYGDGNTATPRFCVVSFAANGSTITPNTRFTGPASNIPSGGATYYAGMFNSTDGYVLSNGGGATYIRICPVVITGGVTITYAAAWVDIHTSLSGSFYSAIALSGNRVAVLFNNSADSNYLSIKVLTLSGTTVGSSGSVTRITAATSTGQLVATPGGTYVSNAGNLFKLTITGNTVTVGSAIVVTGTAPSVPSSSVPYNIAGSADGTYNYLAVQHTSSPGTGFSQLNEVPV